MSEKEWFSFSKAIFEGEGKTFIDTFLKEGHDINALKRDGCTALSYACKYGKLDIVTYLVQIGAASTIKNSDYTIPIHIAAQYGHVDIVEFFHNLGVSIDSCGNNYYRPLHYAAEEGHIKVVEFLVKKKACINAKTHQGNTSLLLSAKNRHRDITELLINAGADVKCSGEDKYTVLHHASRNGWLEIVRSQLNKKCELNVKTSQGVTPLQLAMQYQQKKVFDLLISAGADIEYCGHDGYTLLHFASLNGWLEIGDDSTCRDRAKQVCRQSRHPRWRM